MIIFERVRFRNFLSTGDSWTEIDLEHGKSTLIVGTNGSGKSTVLDAISLALFNKPYRNIRKPQLINSVNEKGLEVEIFFRDAAHKYVVKRAMKPGWFEIWKDGRLLNQESHARDYQKILENDILRFNHKSFHQIAVLGSSNFVPFMQLPPGQRRLIIEDLLDTTVFSAMNTLAKEKGSNLRENLKTVVYDISRAKDKIAMSDKHIAKLKSIRDLEAERVENEKSDIVSDIAKLEEKRKVLNAAYTSRFVEVCEEFEKSSANISTLAEQIGEIRSLIRSHKTNKEFFGTNSTCPTCTQNISDEFSSKCKTHAEDQISDLGSKLSGFEGEIASSRESHKKLREAQSRLSVIPDKISEIDKNIESLRDKLEKINKAQSTIGEDIDKAEGDRAVYYTACVKLREKKLELDEEIAYNNTVCELLKDSGIKTKIIRQYLPLMNKTINHYLQILDFFVLFELDENFNETIKSRHRDEFSYASFSEGEKQRIDLALLFAWRTIAKSKNSVNTNLLILDEIFDSSLDVDGVDNLLKILHEIKKNTNVFVITHKPESFEGSFNRKITVKKPGNFSTYAVEELS